MGFTGLRKFLGGEYGLVVELARRKGDDYGYRLYLRTPSPAGTVDALRQRLALRYKG